MPSRPKDGKFKDKNGERTRKTKPPKKPKYSPRMQDLIDGKITIKDLDSEEIMRGRVRGPAGGFDGKPYSVVPRQFFEALKAEQMRLWQQKFDEAVEPAMQALLGLVNGQKVSHDAKYKAAVFLIERAAGKTPDKVEVKAELKKWEEGLEGIFFDDGKGEASGDGE